MQAHKKVTALLTVIFAVMASVALATMASRRIDNQSSPQRSNADKKSERVSKLPLVDYDTPEPTDPEKRARRRAKNKSYNNPRGTKIDPVKTSEIGESALNNDWEIELKSSLPTDQSAAIVVGEVLDAKAYLSDDKTNIYSEFTIRVDDVLKNDSEESITTGDSSVLERQGGRVRLQTHVMSYYISGQGTPQVGGKYVFFLGYNKRDAEYRTVSSPRDMNRHILTGYELRAGKVVPLDSAGGIYFQEHSNKNVTDFLNEIRRSVSNSSQVQPE